VPDVVFARFITPDGVLLPIKYSGLSRNQLVDSFVRVLRELDHLLLNDEPITTQGGACYDGAMVPLAGMLAQYWASGHIDRYDISGPDMIHYATRPGHQEGLSEMLACLHRWNPRLVPRHLIVRMFPGTVARIGHISGHVSEGVMSRKVHALRCQGQLSSDHKRRMWDIAKDDECHWPIQINADREHYFSQHDLAAHGGEMEVDDFWKEIPLDSMRDSLLRANALLRLK